MLNHGFDLNDEAAYKLQHEGMDLDKIHAFVFRSLLSADNSTYI